MKIGEQSRVEDLREANRARAKQSLAFFLETILGLRLTPELLVALEQLQQRRLLLEIAEGTALWYQIRGVKLKAKPVDHEAIAWLFPEVGK